MRTDHDIALEISALSTAHLADACQRLGISPRLAPSAIKPLHDQVRAFGRVRPVRHFGSADVIFEALCEAEAGDVLVIDNEGRLDEACAGDLVALEAAGASMAGMIIWGLHRDTAELRSIRLPIFSLGSISCAPSRRDPQAMDALAWAQCGPCTLTSDDYVVCDEDGIIFLQPAELEKTLDVARQIRTAERRQAIKIANGISLRAQMDFGRFLEQRKSNPAISLRDFLQQKDLALE